jgi:signal transduction histidine kinase
MTHFRSARVLRLLRAAVRLSAGVALLCLSLLGPQYGFAWSTPVRYHADAWGTDNGLPDSSIKALCQTRDGYLWLTTGNGLASIDGVRFRVFNMANTPALTRVVAPNSDGLWNQDGADHRIDVLLPFYRTWWFTALAVFSAAWLMLFIHQHRLEQLRNANAAREAFSKRLIESQESERKRIAAELHDSLGQSLMIIKNRAVLGSMASEPDAAAQDLFNEIAVSAANSIEEVRQIAYNLRPPHLDRLGLTQALKAMIEKVAAATAIHFRSEVDPLDGLFPEEDEITVLRLVQECITNIVKHSQAIEANVTIERGSGLVTITIQDNGRGFGATAPAAGAGGFGLISLSERVRILGGHQVIQSTHEGTTITIWLPIRCGGPASS